jgi:hypothetical protein
MSLPLFRLEGDTGKQSTLHCTNIETLPVYYSQMDRSIQDMEIDDDQNYSSHPTHRAGAPKAQQWLTVLHKCLWNKLFVTTCQTSSNLLDNIYPVFLQVLCKGFRGWQFEPNHQSGPRFGQGVL